MLDVSECDGGLDHWARRLVSMSSPSVARLRRNYVSVTALRWMPAGFVAPILVLLPLSRGLDLAEVGVVFAVYAGSTAVLELPTGGLADSIGRKRVLLIASCSHLLFYGALLIAEGLVTWLVVAAMGGAARALDSGPLEAWFVDEVLTQGTNDDLQRGLSLAMASGAISLASATIGGGLLPTFFAGSLTASVVGAVFAQALHLAGVALLVAEVNRVPEGTAQSGLARWRGTVQSAVRLSATRGPVRRLLGVSVVLGVALTALELLWQPRFSSLLGGLSQQTTTPTLGLLLAAAFVLSSVGSAVAPRTLRVFRGNPRAGAFYAVTGQGVFLLALSLSSNGVMAGIFFLVVYLHVGLQSPMHQELLHQHVSSSQRSTMLSAESLLMQAGGLLSSLAAPALADRYSIGVVWSVVGAGLVMAAFLYRGIGVAGLRQSRHEDEASKPH